MSEIENTIVKYYFKVPYTEKTQFIDFDTNITINDLINVIDYCKKVYFDIDENVIVELVECGNTINGDAEKAPAIIGTDETLLEKYGIKKKSFYVRPKEAVV